MMTKASTLALRLYAVVLVGFAVSVGPVHAQQRFGPGPYQFVKAERVTVAAEDICVLQPGPAVPDSEIAPRMSLRGPQAPTFEQAATFEVQYEGFDGEEGQQARVAFQRAVDIWARHVASEVPIKIRASFEEQDPGVLGSARPFSQWFLIEDGAGDVDCTDPAENEPCTIFPDALADALLGENVVLLNEDPSDDGDPDIEAFFSSEASWYYGTGEPGPNQFDFTSVVLHELGHGLGFYGSMSVENADADPALEGVWPFRTNNVGLPPAVYDLFAEDGQSGSLVDEDVYPNPSEPLADVLRGGSLFFGALPATRQALGGERPELYAPADWSQGSSYSHLDDGTYPAGDDDALMTPRIGFREVIDRPGAITCGMFRDMGWPMGPACLALLQSDLLFVDAVLLDEGQLEIGWQLAPDSDKDLFRVQRRAFPPGSLGGDQACAVAEGTPDPQFETVRTFRAGDGTGAGGNTFQYTTGDLGVGCYDFRLLLVEEGSGASLPIPLMSDPFRVGLLPGAGDEVLDVTFEREGFEAAISWQVPPPTEGLSYGHFRVQRCLTGTCTEDSGFETIEVIAGASGTQTAEVDLLGPGDYAFRLLMEVIDADTGARYFVRGDVVDVSQEFTGAYALSAPYPNPVVTRAQLTLTTKTRQTAVVEVYNALGQRVLERRVRLAPRQPETVELGAGRLASGVYFVRVSGDGFAATRQFVVVR